MSWFGFTEEEEECKDPNRRRLIIDLIGGRSITDPKNKSKEGVPVYGDVFCTLKCGNQHFQTEIMKRSMNPSWEQSFTLEMEELTDSAVVEITCYFNGVLSNTFIGEVRIPVVNHQNVSYEYSLSHWFPLYNPKLSKKDGSPGEICVKIGVEGGPSFSASITSMESLDDFTAEQIYEEANLYASAANASAKNALRLIEQTRDISSNTSIQLRSQGEQIERMQMDMETIHNNMRQSERKLRSIESVWGSLANKMTSSSNAKSKKKAQLDRKLVKKRKKEEEKIMRLKESAWEEKRETDHYLSRRRDNMIQRDPGSKRSESGSQEEQFYMTIDDTDKTIDLISSALDDVKIVSLDIKTQLTIDAERLTALSYDVNKAIPRMDDATRRARSIAQS